MNPNPNITDAERGELLVKLDGSDLILSDWEISFIGTFMEHPMTFHWTEARRVSVDKMRMKYGHEREIGMPMESVKGSVSSVQPQEQGAARAERRALPTACQYRVRTDGRQQACGEPAKWQTTVKGFRYCQLHAEKAQEELRWQKKEISLRRIEP